MPGPAGRRRRSSASRRRACGPGPALSSGAVGLGPRLQSRSPTSGSSLRGRATQRRSPPTSCASPVGPNGGGRPSAPGFAGGGLPRQSSSSSLESEVPSLTTQQVWHAVRMRASSPSPPGRVFTFPREYAENSSVSSSSNSPGSSDQSCPPSPTNFSDGRSIPSSASFSGVGSIATSSPPGVRRMLLPELEALSPLSSEEPAEEGSPPPSPPSPVL